MKRAFGNSFKDVHRAARAAGAAHMRVSLSGGKPRRGGAALFVLCLIFAASILMLSLADYASMELKDRAASQYENELRIDAYSALSAAIAVLEEYRALDGNLYSAVQGWGEPLKDGRVTFDNFEADVRITDETGKIPLALLNTADLIAIFEEMDISTTEAQELADCLLDWTDADGAKRINGAETDDYEDEEPKPPNRALKSLMELRHIMKFRDVFFDKDGSPNELYFRFANIVSVENFDKVNMNSASEEVLEMLMEICGRDYDSNIYRAIRGEIGTIDKGILWVKSASEAISRGAPDMPDSKWRTFTASLLKIEITVKRGIAEYYLCAYYGAESKNSVTGGANKDRSKRLTNTKSASSSGGSKTANMSRVGMGASSSTKARSQSSDTKKAASGSARILEIRERGR